MFHDVHQRFRSCHLQLVAKKIVGWNTRTRRGSCRSRWPLACWDFGFESRGAWTFVSRECCVLSGRGLCDGPIFRQEESYRVCVCVCERERERECVCVIEWNHVQQQPLNLQ